MNSELREKFYTNRYLPLLVGAIFFAFNAWYSHRFYHVNSFKLVYMAIMLVTCFVIYDLGMVFHRMQQRTSIESFVFPWKVALLYLLPTLATLPGYFLQIDSMVSYNFNYEWTTRLIVLLWIVYIVRFVSNDQTLRRFLLMMGFSMVFVAILVIIEWQGWWPAVLQSGVQDRVRITYGNPNYLAGAMVSVLPFFLSLLIPTIHFSKRQQKQQKEPKKNQSVHNQENRIFKDKKMHLYCALFFLTSLISLLLASSRAAFGGVMLGCVGVLVIVLHEVINPTRNKKRILWFSISSAILLAVLIAFIYSFRNQLQNLSRLFAVFEAKNWISRWAPWEAAWSAFKEAPIFGYGLGGSYALFFRFVGPDTRLFADLRSYNHAHSEWLEYLTEGGIFGYIFFFILWGYILRHLIRIYRVSSNQFHRRLALGIGGGIIGYHFHGIFSVVQRMVVTQIPLYALVALAFVLIGLNNRQEPGRLAKHTHLQSLRARLMKWPPLVRNQLPCLVIFSIIALLYIPWARGQYRFSQLLTYPITSTEEHLEAIARLKWVTEQQRDIYALDTLMRWQYNLGLRDEALETFEVIDQVIPNYRTSRFIRAVILYEQGQLAEAREAVDAYIATDVYNSDAQRLVHLTALQSGDRDAYLRNLGRIASNKNWKSQENFLLYTIDFAVSSQQAASVVLEEPGEEDRLTISFSSSFMEQTFFPLLHSIYRSSSNEEYMQARDNFLLLLQQQLLNAAFTNEYISLIAQDANTENFNDIANFQLELLNGEINLLQDSFFEDIQNIQELLPIENWSEITQKLGYIRTFLRSYSGIIA